MSGDIPHPSAAGAAQIGASSGVRVAQAGFERHTTRENIREFFDPNRYRTRNSGSAATSELCERHTTPENIRVFFDPATYKRAQKRPAEVPAAGAVRAAPKAKTMSKEDLVKNFHLAAELNGIAWDELAVFWCC